MANLAHLATLVLVRALLFVIPRRHSSSNLGLGLGSRSRCFFWRSKCADRALVRPSAGAVAVGLAAALRYPDDALAEAVAAAGLALRLLCSSGWLLLIDDSDWWLCHDH